MKQRIESKSESFKPFDLVISIESKDDLAKILAASFILNNQTRQTLEYCKNTMRGYNPTTCNYESMVEVSNMLANNEQYSEYLKIVLE